MIDLRPLKDDAFKFPDPIRSMIQSEDDFLQEEQFIKKFIKWRQKASEIDSLRKVQK